ncbi:MAG TPA: LacI family DNA-binding transcriptional regulator [Candidatus Lachnoclostridium pullistercoris]|uniref:Ribokinase n=1 Tax=Candidatus Lachnoclostridium pullistercoris TaxID=2838632 RepID=A0A9D2T6I5_9FIRM|nr:LacI family DNA-binding transcriptional regulator [Candidatus Lachnoclostridium pullistercoris]
MTIKELARIAGVSVSTVSKVMNQKDEGISADTRERILNLAREYGYSPYSSISTIPSKTPLIGVVMRSQSQEIAEGIMEQAQALGHRVIYSVSGNSLKTESQTLNILCRAKVDGILWEPVSSASLSLKTIPDKAGIPYLLFQCPWAADSECIKYDSLAAFAVQNLLERYHTSIACLLSDPEEDSLFLEGYKKCLFDHGILPKDSLVFSEISPLLLQKISSRLVSAVVCSNYTNALELYGKLTSLHYSIPRELSVIAMKDGQFQELPFPSISCCPVPERAFGQYLTDKLLHWDDPEWSRKTFRPKISLNGFSTVAFPPHMQEERILVVGSINIDHYLNVDQLPYSGKTVMTTDSLVFPGGKGINQAVGVSRLGHMVTLVGCVGTDTDAEIIDTAMEKYSLDTSGIKRVSGEQTGKAYIFVQKNGESIISILSGANHCLTPDDIARNHSLFEHAGYCLIQTELPDETVAAACRAARAYGVKTILKPSARHHLIPEILENVDILVPNLDEINELCPQEPSLEKQAEYFLNLGISTVIVTLGKNGCYMKNASEEMYLPAENFLSIDNTGAGDAFISALASYLLYGYEMKDAIRIANLAAGFSVTRRGVAPALIDKSTLEAYLRQKYPNLLKSRTDEAVQPI